MAKSKNHANQQESSFMGKLLATKKAQEGSLQAAEDEDFASKYPLLNELLTQRLKDGEKVIEPASITVWAKQGGWHACVSHKVLKVKWFAEANAFEGLWKALESSVAHENGQETTGG